MKMSTFIIGLVLIGLIIGGVNLFIADVTQTYSVDYNSSELGVYNTTLTNMQNLTTELHNTSIAKQDAKTGFTDIIGGFISDAINSLKIAWGSYTTFDFIMREGLRQVGLPDMVRVAFSTIIIIAVIVGIIISAMVKRDL